MKAEVDPIDWTVQSMGSTSDPAYLGHTLTGDQHRDYLLKRGLMKSQAGLQTEATEAAGGDGEGKVAINIPSATGLDSRRLDIAEQLVAQEFLKNQLELEKIDIHKLGRFAPKFKEVGEQTGTEKVGKYLVEIDQRGNQVSIGDETILRLFRHSGGGMRRIC